MRKIKGTRQRALQSLRDVRRETRRKFDKIIRDAAAWWKETRRRHIKAGDIKEAIRVAKKGLRLPDWVTQYLSSRPTLSTVPA